MLRSLIARVPALSRLATRQQSTSAATAAVKSATKTPAVAERLLASHGAESHPLGAAANPAAAVSKNVKMAAEGLPAAAATLDERHITSRYGLDLPLDVHHPIEGMSDRVARRIVTLLRIPMDAFFSKRYISRAVMLETVAAVPGMVGGMLQHLKSLRRMKDDRGWIYTLLEEAENERMHLLTFVKLLQPSWPERMLVLFAQGIMFNVYFLLYLFAPKTAHRFVGYLEEEAIVSYTSFLKEIDEGHIKNAPAPDIAKRYWNMPDDATLRDLVIAIRMDEAMHRDVNHGFADAIVRQRRGDKSA